ncbi:MAG TPA: hypothetical protein VIL37_08180 [Natronosporangium sp.]
MATAEPPHRGRLAGWLRDRLRIPRGPGYWAVTLVVGSFAALAGWAVAGAIAVGTLPPPPDERQAIAVAELAFGQPPRNLPGPIVRCRDYCLNTWERGGDEVMVFDDPRYRNGGVDHTTVVSWDPDLATAAAVEQARHRLAGDGWRIASQPYPRGAISSGPFGPPVQGFTAYRDDFAVHVHRYSGGGLPPLALTLEPNRPAEVLTAAAVAGAGAGLLAGWLTISWLLRRYRHHNQLVKTAIGLFALPILVVMVLLQLFTGQLFAQAVDSTTPLALVPTIVMHLLGVLWIPQAMAIAIGLAIVVAGQRVAPRQPDPAPIR